MEEQTYLQAPGVIVTSTRIDIGGQTFAVRNIGSVKVTRPGKPWFAALLLIVGLLTLTSSPIAGLAIAGGAAAWMYQQLRTRSLVLVSGGGEETALKSTNGAQVEQLRAAIAQAIAAR